MNFVINTRISFGVGDAIAFSGAVVYKAERDGKFCFPCFQKFMPSVQSFYVNHPKVSVITLEDAQDRMATEPAVNAGIQMLMAPAVVQAETVADIRVDQYESYYNTMGIPYAERWESCPIPEAAKSIPQVMTTGAIFVHDDPSRGMTIKTAWPKLETRPDNDLTQSILRYCWMIEHAEEVHVFDSAFFHLAEQLEPVGQLFYHRYLKKPYFKTWNDYKTRHPWMTVDTGKT